MVDHARTPNDDDFDSMLDEVDSIVDYLRQHHKQARKRARFAVKDGYPTSSLPESEIHSGRTGDPTADYVLSLTSGDGIKPDHWEIPKDPIVVHVNNMGREVEDARNRLRGASSSLRKAVPSAVPDPDREQCVTCWMSKTVATKRGKNPQGWVVAESRCSACSKRLARHSAPNRTKVAGG